MSGRKRDVKTPSEGFIRLAMLAPFSTYLTRRGVDVGPIVRDFGVDPNALTDPEVFVHAEVIYGIIGAYANAANDPHFGVHVGEWLDIVSWPPFFEAARSARTLGEFFTLFIEAVPREANTVVHSLTVKPDEATYGVTRSIVPNNDPSHVYAFGVGVFMRLFGAIGAEGSDIDRLEIRLPNPKVIPPGYKGVRIRRFPGNAYEYRFPVEWLRRSIELHSKLAAPPNALRDEEVSEVSVVGAFRAAALPLLGDLSVGVGEVAAALGLDSRRLSEALSRQGTSAAKELRRLRVEEAKSALSTSDVPVREIALQLGYSDPAHFSRFFKSQTDQSPRTFRGAFCETTG